MLHNIKYRQLKAFAIIAETGLFRVAADRLSVTQPSMSVMIKELEQDVGIELINRSTRNAELTEAGREFYEQIKGSLEQLEKAYSYAKAAGKAEHGRIALATLPTLAASVVGPMISAFHKKYPGVSIELVERTYDNFIRALRQQEVNFGIGILRSEEPELSFKLLYRDRLVIVAPKGHPVTCSATDLETLSGYDIVMISAGPAPEALSKLNTEQPRMHVEQPATAIAMVRNGAGLTITASSALVGIDMRGLECIPVPGSFSYRDVGILKRIDKKLSPVSRRFIEDLEASIVHHGLHHAK